MEQQVVLTNESGAILGEAASTRVHREALLHSAFSVFIFDEAGRLLMQKRSARHNCCAGLWSNTCRGHTPPGQTAAEAAHTGLLLTMGFDTGLEELGAFIWDTCTHRNYYEHELVHVFCGGWSGTPQPDPMATDEYEWISLEDLQRQVKNGRKDCASWFPIALTVIRINQGFKFAPHNGQVPLKREYI